MLLNTWLSIARRRLSAAAVRRAGRLRQPQSSRLESLENRMLLSGNPIDALVINSENQALFTNPAGGLVITNASLGSKDGLVIEGISVSTSSGDAISISLSNVPLRRLAIESVTITQANTVGINLDLTNVTELNSVALEDLIVRGNGRGVDLNFVNTDTGSLTIEDSEIAGILVTATQGSEISNGVIADNVINAPAGVEGVFLDVQSTPGVVSTANNFQIVNNSQISTQDRDAVRINAAATLDANRNTVTALDGLSIAGNGIGSSEGANVLFRAEGDTFIQPFTLTNRSVRNERLQTFVFDLRDIGLQFDPDPTTGKPFSPVGGTGAVTGFSSAILSNNNQTLTVSFTDFAPGETLQFVLDIDFLGPVPASIFGNQLIGADVQFNFRDLQNQVKNLSGQMAGDPAFVSASQFLPGAGIAGVTHGLQISASGVPVTNASIRNNTISGSPGNGLFLNSRLYSDISGIFSGNTISGAGQDGIRVSMQDSRFAGMIRSNAVSNNGGHGISLLPTASRAGRIQTVTGGALNTPFVITSPNHGLQSGDYVILQGIQEADDSINHRANGQFTVTRLTNNTFSLQGTGLNYGRVFSYAGGGSWYLPDFRGGNADQNAARGFAQIDLKVDSAAQPISDATNTPDICITSAAHGLRTGDLVRITGVQGNGNANGTYAVTVISADKFLLKGRAGNGDYTVGGEWIRLDETDSNGRTVLQGIQGNTITSNRGAGIFARPEVGSTVRADIIGNVISANEDKGVLFQSYSFGLGTALPLPEGSPDATVASQDLGYSVMIGDESPGQGNLSGGGNTLNSNSGAAIALEALDYGTGSFEIWNNTITSTRDDANAATPYTGDGIFVRLDDGRITADASALLQQSIIRNNVIGVDNQGNAGNGLFFSMRERTRIQTLDIGFNTFLNSGLDGFHFERSEDARLNLLRFEKNRSTNNTGDGFDLFAKNTTLDRQDFDINDNFIEDNGQYGLRVDAQADARLGIDFNNNSVRRNGHTPAGQGFHANDGTSGSAGAAGGVGIRGFQQIDIIFNATDTVISDNTGDGISIDAFRYFDTLKVSSVFTRVNIENNTRTGLRNNGAAFGGFDLFDCSLSNNGEDGFRSISVEDKLDPYRRRVGCMDLDLRVMRSVFNGNANDGVQLGQGLSAVFGDGTALNANSFDFNGRSGLMITQHNSPYLDRLTSIGDERRRHVQVNYATFQFNGAAGVDIGIDAAQEGGNVEHGDEVASDIAVTINNAQIIGNTLDGVEYLGDDTFRIGRAPGGGQDVPARFNSALAVYNSRIANNGGRGVDILNRHQQDTYVTLTGNEILSNALEGIYVFNTASIGQRQVNSADAFVPDLTGSPVPNPNIELRVQQNLIQSNGSFNAQSRVPTTFERGQNDAGGTPVLDWMHADTLIQGTLGGLVIRVGTADTIGRLETAFAGPELSLSGIDAEVWQNRFDGNYGTDVYFDNIITQIPPHSGDRFNAGDTPQFRWNQGYRDPLSRFDLVFRGNTGNSLDVINGFAFLDNIEAEFKSRNTAANQAPPDHGQHDNDPPGHWINSGRPRNATRTIGSTFDQVGDDPSANPMRLRDGSIFGAVPFWSYDGMGTPTWRVESDFEFAGFNQTSPTQGFSTFYNLVTLDGPDPNQDGIIADYQWDTGVNTPSFIGATPYSLNRGDVFNVRPGEAPIVADAFENNNSFVGASRLGTVAGNGNSINALTPNGNLNIHLKADRDYYRFTAGGTGDLTVNLSVNNSADSDLYYMIYEVRSSSQTEEVALVLNADGTTAFQTAANGSPSALTVPVTEGRDYIIEILSDELESTGISFNGKPFVYGTVRSYSLIIDAPALSGGGGGGGGG
ncbi:MAG: hypothetical protein RL215_3329, partial [Planctomycetota bacterium]